VVAGGIIGPLAVIYRVARHFNDRICVDSHYRVTSGGYILVIDQRNANVLEGNWSKDPESGRKS